MSQRKIEDIYPLSPMQQGMLFHTLFDPASGAYFEQVSCLLRGELNLAALKHAWEQIIDRYTVLRTAFNWERRDEPFQVVYREVALPWEEQDWRALPATEQAERFEGFLLADVERGFELSKAPLMRLTLIQLDERTYRFVWSQHHLLMDGWCRPLILKEIFALYEASCRGQQLQLAPTRPYGDYIAWLQQQDQSRADSYWREALKGFTRPNRIGLERASKQTRGLEDQYGAQSIRLSIETTAALQALARRHRLTLNTLLQGAWAVLLSRHSGDDDVVFGATVSGRPPAMTGIESMIGLFINAIPVRIQITPGMPLLSWLKELQARQAEARQYEHISLVKAHELSEVPPGLPLFESLLTFINYPNTPLQQQNGSLEISETRYSQRQNYPLSLRISPDLELGLEIDHDLNRYDAATIQLLLGHLQSLLAAMLADTEQPLATLAMMSDEERAQIEQWNRTAQDYGEVKCLHRMFEEQVARTASNIALVYEDQHLTYEELNRRANRTAHYLRSLGVGAESLVGVMMQRSVELVVALLGVLKAGAGYVPLDGSYPQARLSYMAEDAGISVLLTQQRLLGRVPEQCQQAICLDDDWEVIAQESEDNPESEVNVDNLAYLIYTSGSTGSPKGVMISHRSISNRLLWMQHRFPLSASDRLLHKTPFSFDASVWELFVPLLCGASIVIARPGGHQESAYLVQVMREQEVTTIQLVPSMLKLMLEEAGIEQARSVRQVYSGGEALGAQVVERFKQRMRWAKLRNLYGPTEVSIDATSWESESGSNNESNSGSNSESSSGREQEQAERQEQGRERAAEPIAAQAEARVEAQVIPIGRAIGNMQVYVLNAEQQMVPVGVKGELYIAGVGLARGYINRADLTGEKFVPNAYSDEAGARMYRTGDVGRYLSDGNIEYLGRADEQVKIRGYRIELGEIEAALMAEAEVKQSVVVVREREGDQRIVAYLVMEQEAERMEAGELRARVGKRLPEYMIPNAFVEVEALPLTPNGKIDRRALPEPDKPQSNSGHDFVAPRTLVEREMVEIWRELLGVDQISIHDNFIELGGHSILLIQLASRIKKIFKVELPLRSIFDAPTVVEMTMLITAKQLEEENAAEMARMLEELKSLSPQEVKELLEAEERLNM